MADWTRAKIYSHSTLAQGGCAGFAKHPDSGLQTYGTAPKNLLVRPVSGRKPKVVLRTFTRTGKDDDLIVTKEIVSKFGGTSEAEVQVKIVGAVSRFWNTPGAVLDAAVATSTCAATLVAAVFAYVKLVIDSHAKSGSRTSGIVLALAAVVLLLAAVAAVLRLVKDVKAARNG